MWRHIRQSLPYIAVVCVLVGVGYCVGDRHTRDRELRLLAPLPQHPAIEAAFNQSQAAAYQDPYRTEMPLRHGDDLEALILENLDQAERSIYVAVQDLNLPLIAHKLVERHRQGLDVRVILENTYTRSPEELSNQDDVEIESAAALLPLLDLDGDGVVTATERSQRDVLTILTEGGVRWHDDTADGSAGSGLMHHKFIVIDEERVVTGSANFTLSDIHGDFGEPDSVGNHNHLLVFDDPALALLFGQEFRLMWGDNSTPRFGLQKPERPPQRFRIGDAIVTARFSPSSRSAPYASTSNGFIADMLSRASSSIDLAMFVFSDAGIANQLRHLASTNNLAVRGVFDPGFAFRYYSASVAMWGERLPASTSSCQFTEHIPWQPGLASVGVPDIAETDKLHHKFAIVDNRLVLTGSHNWSPSANHQNDETVLLLESPTVTAHFVREFERLYSSANVGVPSFVTTRAQEAIQRCGEPSPLVAALPGRAASINLNTASVAELETLPGIGPAIAQLIIEARPIRSLDDLQRVNGIGPAKVEALRGQVTW